MKKLAVLPALFAIQVVLAQTAVTNTGILHISGGTDVLYAAGNFTNNAGALLTNNGQLYVRGNLTNGEVSMSPGTGTLILNAPSAQSVNGTQAFRTFNLTTNNTAGITLNNSLSLSGTHTFIAGNITSASSSNFLVYESGSSHTGAGDGKAVTGWVKKLGTTDFIFPVGNASYLRTIAISNLSGGSEFDATYSGATTNANTLSSPIVSINQYEHWTLNKQSGGTAQVILNWDKSKVNFPSYTLSDILSSRFGGSWVSTGGTATGSVSTSGSIMSAAQSTFGPFVIGSSIMALPLHLLSVTARRSDDYTTISWKTANEENVAWHEIQKSSSSNNFHTIGRIAAKNQKEQTYQHIDPAHLNGTCYYRIKSIDQDQKFTYSSIVSVTQKSGIEALNLFINPVKTNIMINGAKPFQNYHYSLYSIDGKLIQRGSVHASTHLLSISLTSGIAPGSYVLKMDGKGQELSKKIIIE
jgi:hypothetical protein